MKFILIRKAKAEEEKVETHTQVQRLDSRDAAKVKQLRQIGADSDGVGLKSDNLRRGCRLQDRGAVQG